MATIVCQGLQSCLDSQIHEPIRAIRLKLSCSIDEKKIPSTYNDDDDDGGVGVDSYCWKSFFQAFSNNNGFSNSNKETTTTTYVHPLDARFKSTLSEKSLELCTENLGSETGTDIIEDDGCCGGGGIFSLLSENGGNFSPRKDQQRECDVIKKVSPKNFPPPLTTITGVESLRVRPQRENGRLIMKAIKAATLPQCSVFQAERTDGRLRLCIFEASDDEEEEEEIENDVVVGEEREEGDAVEDDFEEENYEYMGEEEEDEEEGVNGENRDVGGKMGIKKFEKSRRCKEGEPEKKGLLNWEGLWVATS